MHQNRANEAKRRQVIVDELYADFYNSIQNGQFLQDERFPTESDLCRNYGVNRSTVRKALALLEDDGAITAMQGSGRRVLVSKSNQVKKKVVSDHIEDLKNCFECRIALEGEIAYFAALRHTNTTLTALDAHASRMQIILKSGNIHTNEDTEFHITLAKASNNTLFVTMMTTLRPFILLGMNVSKTLEPEIYRQHANASFCEHQIIIEAIRQRDCDAARVAMRRHLANSRDRIFGT